MNYKSLQSKARRNGFVLSKTEYPSHAQYNLSVREHNPVEAKYFAGRTVLSTPNIESISTFIDNNKNTYSCEFNMDYWNRVEA